MSRGMPQDILLAQRRICATHDVSWFDARWDLKVGIAGNVKGDLFPVNGLRHPPQGDTTGWYIWAGEEFPTGEGAFLPLHVSHLVEWCPLALSYLGLPPGWRFLTDGDYDDVWEDLSLLDI